MKDFTYTCTKKLENKAQFKKINALVDLCNSKDGTSIDFSEDAADDDINKLMISCGSEAAAYFGIAANQNFQHSYAWGVISPKFYSIAHQDKIAQILKKVCLKLEVKLLNIVIDDDANNFLTFVSHIGGKKIYSVYNMYCNADLWHKHKYKQEELYIKRASLDDIEQIASVGMEAFGTDKSDEVTYYTPCLTTDKCHCFTGQLGDETIGIITVKADGCDGIISDLAILGKYRRQGFGETMLQKTMEHMHNEGIHSFTLSVQTDNLYAYALYQRCGFHPKNIKLCYELCLSDHAL